MMNELLAWLALPWSGNPDHLIAPAVAWHGRLMVLAWGAAVPVAVLLARYFKVTPWQDWPRQLDHKFWWHGHRVLNYGAVVVSCAAAALVWSAQGYIGPARALHAWLGWTVVGLGLLQVLGGHLRGSKGGPTEPRLGPDGRVIDLHGDHYDMTRRRCAFEWVHKVLGYGALALTLVALLVGLWVADAPRWMWLGLAGWWLVLFAVAARFQRQGRCIDTYQAIWGTDPHHPGAAVGPIGWGVRRLGADKPSMERT